MDFSATCGPRDWNNSPNISLAAVWVIAGTSYGLLISLAGPRKFSKRQGLNVEDATLMGFGGFSKVKSISDLSPKNEGWRPASSWGSKLEVGRNLSLVTNIVKMNHLIFTAFLTACLGIEGYQPGSATFGPSSEGLGQVYYEEPGQLNS
ncbi:hypothetical protein DSO57_1004135 [Entomophthora muscae]|uniref:Uncharacterized protein n=1 Tax=Entomophthora muscae TaxID=34485 RepID=A0ACC2TJM4_9FUNG|nr:hypothetical protein DSO57_1004135 [Entomophthora muscae]